MVRKSFGRGFRFWCRCRSLSKICVVLSCFQSSVFWYFDIFFSTEWWFWIQTSIYTVKTTLNFAMNQARLHPTSVFQFLQETNKVVMHYFRGQTWLRNKNQSSPSVTPWLRYFFSVAGNSLISTFHRSRYKMIQTWPNLVQFWIALILTNR